MQIISSLSINGIRRYSELKRSLLGITNTILSNSLKEPETDHFVIRTQYNEMPLRVEYSLYEQTGNTSADWMKCSKNQQILKEQPVKRLLFSWKFLSGKPEFFSDLFVTLFADFYTNAAYQGICVSSKVAR